MKQHLQEDGWDNIDLEETQSTKELQVQTRYQPKDGARDILDSHHHSLEPDMVMGWKPKLPSCPLPLSYNNAYVDALTTYIPTDDRFKVAYFGPRYSNSVQINQQYNYYWRYRSRYNTTLNVVKEAIKRVGQNGKRVLPDINPSEPTFDSAFEGGNLDMAVRVKKSEYDLFLRCDTNTRGHTAWFYFKVDNKEQLGQIKFNICNFGKKKNLYAQGMKPYVKKDNEWKQTQCYQVVWAERLCRYGFDRKTFQLQFKYNFKEKNSPVYFAYSIPYTYSQLQNFITGITDSSSRYIKTSKLCQSLGGLDLPLLTITNNPQGEENTDENTTFSDERKKKVALITGRIHPGESHASYILEGFISFLVSEDPAAAMLRSSFIFQIVPMLNPDGVVAGNFRTSFSGKDLNRQFKKLNKNIFPEITYLNDLATQLKHSYRSRLHYYFDFHSHASKRGLFCYGPQHLAGSPDFFRSRAIAKLIEQKTPIFNYTKSIFTVSEAKRATGRAHMLWKIKIPMTFTFEVSNGLFETKETRNNPLSQHVLRSSGATILHGFYRFYQLQQKLPILKAKAKVDTGIKKRGGLSAKQFRRNSSKKTKNITLKNIEDLRLFSRTKSSRKDRSLKKGSLQDVLQAEDFQKTLKESKRQYLELIEEIRNEEAESKIVDEYEGGSDSESDQDDLNDKEINKLHKIIESRNESTKFYNQTNLQWRCQKRGGDVMRKQSESQENKISHSSQEIEGSRKPVTAKYLAPIKNSNLPPRAKRIPYLCPQKEVLMPKNFDIDF